MSVSFLPAIHNDRNFASQDEKDVVIRISLFNKSALGLSWVDLNKFNQIRQVLGKIFVIMDTLLCSKRSDQARVTVWTLEASNHKVLR